MRRKQTKPRCSFTSSPPNGEWKPICFASRFLTDFQSKHSISELELLAIVCAVEHFRNYVYGLQFEIISDHKALMSVLKSNRGDKTFSHQRWIDILLPFDFEVVHVAGRTLEMAYYLSRHPREIQVSSIKAATLLNERFTVNILIRLNDVLDNKEASSEKTRPGESANEALAVNCINRADRRQPIKTQDKHNLWETSEIHCSITAHIRKMSQVCQQNY